MCAADVSDSIRSTAAAHLTAIASYCTVPGMGYAIGKHFESFIDRLIRTGRYGNKSEVIRAALQKF